ncbi:MAG TPA: toll/interleukin-1 receptor domain-containing protein [Chitinophagaceae bacterium]|nr:toll/interleukin-1 receptor domain-containing protein [Chitinophagaceae bacterium]
MADQSDIGEKLKRDVVIISHATPKDNDYTKWLALKLTGLGYHVWCDILELQKGTDFWRDIENVLRQNTCKFLIVLSNISNQSQGVLNEIATAIKVKKQLKDDSFVIPLVIERL